MSSRLRYVGMIGGRYYRGPQLFEVVKGLMMLPSALVPKRFTIAQLISAVDSVKGRLWVFREPRKTAKRRSLYQILCSYYGCSVRIKEKKIGLAPQIGYKAVHINQPKLAFDPEFVVEKEDYFTGDF